MFAEDLRNPTIGVATTNPGKIQAVRDAFQQLFPSLDFTFVPCAAASGVSDQPMTDEETLKGEKKNRKSH